MCGRMTLAQADLGEVATALQASVTAEFVSEWKPRHNVTPTQRHPVLVLEDDTRWLRPARWGFPRPEGKGVLNNARSETAKHLPAFRGSYDRRCLVVADGFYEWGKAGERTKGTPPTWFHAAAGGLLLFGALWMPGADGEPPRFTVLTTAPNRVIATVHDRMPVIVAPERVEEWVRVGGRAFFAPAPDELLAARLVSTRVNSPKFDDAACLEAQAAPLALNL